MRGGRSLALAVAALAAVAGCGSSGSAVLGDTPQPILTTAPATHAAKAMHKHHRAAAAPSRSASKMPTHAPTTAAPQSTSPRPAATHTATRAPSPTPAPCAATGATASLTMVDQPGNMSAPSQFSPRTLDIKCGDAVKVTNNSTSSHTWTPTHGGFADSGNMNPGAAYTATFHYRGTFGFLCTYHPYMTGKVVVQ